MFYQLITNSNRQSFLAELSLICPPFNIDLIIETDEAIFQKKIEAKSPDIVFIDLKDMDPASLDLLKAIIQIKKEQHRLFLIFILTDPTIPHLNLIPSHLYSDIHGICYDQNLSLTLQVLIQTALRQLKQNIEVSLLDATETLITQKIFEEKVASERKISALKSIILKYRNLYKAVRTINSSIKINEAFHIILHILAKLLNAKTISIMLVDFTTNELVVQAAKHERNVIGERKRIGEGVSGMVALTGQPIIVPDLQNDHINQFIDAKSISDSYICVPLKNEDVVIGVINVTQKVDGGFFTLKDKKIILEVAKQISLAIINASLYSSVEILALQDGLTKLYNRNFFQKGLNEEIKKAKLQSYNISLLMLDIDFFKSTNDDYGHQVGDEVLKKVAHILKIHVRRTDIAARYGGEELIAILSGASSEEAFNVGETIRNQIQNMKLYCIQVKSKKHEIKNLLFLCNENNIIEILLYPFSPGEGPLPTKNDWHIELQKYVLDGKPLDTFKIDHIKISRVNIAVSIGIASYPDDIEFSSKANTILEATNEQDILLYMTDKALHHAKKNGRNRTLTYKTVQTSFATTVNKELEIHIIKNIMKKLQEKDLPTYTHSIRVGKICELIAQQMNLSKSDQQLAKYGGILHDIGKSFIPDMILLKPAKLTAEEYEIIKTHSNKGAEHIEAYPILHKYINAIRLHHERMNGSGYPERISASRIPTEARIIAVADSYDAMTSPRYYYTAAIDRKASYQEIIKNQDTLFDKAVVDAFKKVIHQIDELENWEPVID